MQVANAHENFSSRIGFLLAAIGAAVGLGNLWKFPYMLGSNGGAAFVLVYVVAIALIATPVMVGEMLIGKYGRRSAPSSFAIAARAVKASPAWRYVGWLGIVTMFLVLSFFSVIAGWSIAYIFKMASGTFSGLEPAAVGAEFDRFLHQPWVLTGWHALFMVLTVAIVARGVKAGIEKAVTFIMPALFFMLVGLVIYGMVAGEFAEAVRYLFQPDFSKITPDVAMSAMGQAFFSVNVGIGAVLTYAAYLPDDADIVKSSAIIAVGDTCVALLAGLMIFPIVFAYDLDPTQGPGLIFVTLSTAFGAMPGGAIIGTVFFVLVFFAALSSSLSMLEVCVSRFAENPNIGRGKAAIVIGIIIFFVGFITLGSFNVMEDVRPLGSLARFQDMNPFGLLDFSITNVLMPVGAMLYAVFIGWFLTNDLILEILRIEDGRLFRAWRFLMRFVVPVAILAIFAFNLAA
jgi:neurotransmitter:Na+ symporter, NSS family